MGNHTCSIPDCDKPARTRDNLCSMHRARVTRHGSPDGRAKRKTEVERVLEKITRADGEECWSWQGSHNPKGYAQLRTRTKNLKVHRVVFEHFMGPIPDGMVVDHACHNRGCVRPGHLRAVTPKQNVENFATLLRAHNTSGHRGVTFHKHSGLWHATATHAGRHYSGGYFKTAEEAGEAAKALRLMLHTHNDLDGKVTDILCH